MPSDSIVITGAREHNLKNIDLVLPRDKLIVITGLSGSGKSSLAFDTIYAEGQRRYVESLSAYARQFLGQMEKPEVDHIEGLSPAISIDQKGTSRNPRSTVGTVTEIYDHLRLLYARIGHPHCPNCGREISKQSIEQIADQVLTLPEGTRLMITAPMVQGRKGEHRDVLDEARRAGFARARVDGDLRDLSETITLDKKFKHDIEVVVDRVVIEPELRSRLHESLEQAAKLGDGLILLIPADANAGIEEMLYSEDYACVYCGISMEEPAPRNFSFNNPHGACPACTGLGMRLEVDPDAVVPDPSLSIDEGALSGWTRGPSQHWLMEVLETVCRKFRISLRTPWDELTAREQRLILYGLPKDETVRMRYVTHSGATRSFDAGYEGVI
ncbi:MAG: excinuclease ABC subunit UvrA, partial [Candidatus Dormibacteraeota bacterium]|nr:excinuclease ABC subunit UvrA [Candidatus Dormibacteraeota bacterium]